MEECSVHLCGLDGREQREDLAHDLVRCWTAVKPQSQWFEGALIGLHHERVLLYVSSVRFVICPTSITAKFLS